MGYFSLLKPLRMGTDCDCSRCALITTSTQGPRSKHWYLLDLILIRSAVIKNILHVRSYHSADCDTDHCLVFCKLKLQPKKFHRIKKQGNPCIDVSKMSQPVVVEEFAEAFEKEIGASQPGDSATEKWETLRDIMHRTALVTLGKKTLKSHDWFEAKSAKMTPPLKASASPLSITSGHPARGICSFSGLPGARF